MRKNDDCQAVLCEQQVILLREEYEVGVNEELTKTAIEDVGRIVAIICAFRKVSTGSNQSHHVIVDG